MMRAKLFIRLLTVILAITSAACAAGKDADSGKLKVAVTIIPQKAFVEAICGDLAEVTVLVPPGYSPESYEPTPKETERFLRSEIYFTIGVPAESSKITSGTGEAGSMKIVRLEEKTAERFPDRAFGSGGRDHHIWLSPRRAQAMVETIAGEMGIIDPDNREAYMSNAAAYIEELQRLDSRIEEIFEGAEKRIFMVFHPSFGYFADDYGLDMRSLEEEGKEATAQGLREMIDMAVNEGIKVIFYQAEAPSKQAVSFAEEIGGSAVKLDPLAEDYINNMEHMAKEIAGAMR